MNNTNEVKTLVTLLENVLNEIDPARDADKMTMSVNDADNESNRLFLASI